MAERQLKERVDGVYEPYCYLINDKYTNTMYIGSRTISSSQKALQSDLGNIYFTSSKVVRELWKTDRDRFEIMEIYECGSNKEALELEEILIDSLNAVESNDFYNQFNSKNGFSTSGFIYSQESKSKMSKKRKDYFDNMSDDEKNDFSSKQSKAQVMRHKNLTDEQRIDIKAKQSKSRKEFWDTVSEDYKEEIFNKVSETRKRQWDEMTDTERKEHVENARLGLLDYYKNVSHDDMEKRNKKRSETWKNMDDKKRKDIRNKQSEKAKNRKKILCQYCKNKFDPGNYTRYHGEKCKKKERD